MWRLRYEARLAMGVLDPQAGSTSARLNPAQDEAVRHARGPLLVLAGAGSGKTRVITHRIARLVEAHRVAPQRILAVSFTNKAAEEMGERMEALLGKERARKLWLSTFHGFGVRFLNEEAGAAFGGSGRARFTIFDQADSVGLLREIMKREHLYPEGKGGERKLDLWAVLARISLWKNARVRPEDVRESAVEYDEVARQAYGHYQSALAAMHAFDFDDLVCVPVRILRERADVRARWRARFEHLLVDEFQDTNAAQFELVELLANEERNVCVVGDDDQSIYGWRGAEVGNILAFEARFPGTRVVKLEENYRSREPILAVANAVIARAANKRYEKRLRAKQPGGERVRLCVLGDAEQEAKFVAREIRDLAKNGGYRRRDVAVLYRSNLQARLVEEELRVEGIAYRVVGGTQFFDRKEVKDVLAYLRAATAPRDELALRRILGTPPRGIGETTVARVERWALAKGVPFVRAILAPEAIPDVPEAAVRGARRLREVLEAARARFAAIEATPAELGRPRLRFAALELLEEAGLTRELKETGTEAERQARWSNVEYVLRALDRFEHAMAEAGEPAAVGKFLQRLAMRRDEDDEEAGDEVTLSSLHAAKGLEWPVVFVIGLNEGTLPHARTLDPKVTEAAPTDVEEERRLFYVGITRARERLYLTRYLRRELRGRVQPTAPSRFLEGLPESAIERYERDDDAPASVEEAAAFGAQLLEMLRNRNPR